MNYKETNKENCILNTLEAWASWCEGEESWATGDDD